MQQLGVGLKVHLIVALWHVIPNRLYLYTMADKHEAGSNHIVETLHRFINQVSIQRHLLLHLFVQLDNCPRENKNHLFLVFTEALLMWGVFESVEVSFFPIGHTHCDVDQSFIATAATLNVRDAVTLNDLHNQLRLCCNKYSQGQPVEGVDELVWII